jgi:hypothetical protein
MIYLKRMGVLFALTVVLSITAFGDDPVPPCDPGETHGPPCASTQLATDDSTVPGQLETPPASDSVDLVTVTEDAITTLLLLTVSW